jgi:hypothetical protein
MNLFITLLENVNKSRTSANNVSLNRKGKLNRVNMKIDVNSRAADQISPIFLTLSGWCSTQT